MASHHEHFARRRNIAERRHLSDEPMLVHIRAVYEENRGAYSWPRIWRQLRAPGIRVEAEGAAARYPARGKRGFRVAITDG